MSDSDKRGQELQDHHNKGEQDGAKGKYDPPHSITPLDTWIHSEKFINEMSEDNKAYDEGRKNANK